MNEVLDAKPKVITSTGEQVTLRAIKAATTSVPVVFISGDPVAEKIVSNLARPGGNLTGFAVLAGDLEAKRLGGQKRKVGPPTGKQSLIAAAGASSLPHSSGTPSAPPSRD